MLAAIIHGFTLALGLILPLGAQNIFVFNQGASQKRLMYAFPVVITASLCDTILILLAVLGVSVVVLTFEWLKVLLFGAGFIFLLYMGWAVWRSNPSSVKEEGEPFSFKKQITFAMSVSLLNPHAILDTVGVIGTSSLYYDGAEKFAFSFACIAVSWAWFFALATAGHMMKKRDQSGAWITLINKMSAIIIWGVALYIGKELLASI
ncbi:MAG: LysE/ArgO family amino acid transporter [Ectobacillus sp.]